MRAIRWMSCGLAVLAAACGGGGAEVQIEEDPAITLERQQAQQEIQQFQQQMMQRQRDLMDSVGSNKPQP